MQNTKRLFIPTITELVGYMVISTAVLLIVNMDIFVSIITEYNADSFNTIFSNRYEEFFSIINQYETTGILVNLIVWGIIGSLVYVLITLVINLVATTKNDISAVNHLASFDSDKSSGRKYVISHLSKGFFRVAILILILGLTLMSLFLWVPLFADIFEVFQLDMLNFKNYILLILSLGGMMAILYIYTVLLRLFFLRTRVFTS